MSWIASRVRENNPLQLQFPYALQTLAMIREPIRTRFAVDPSEVQVGRLMPHPELYRAPSHFTQRSQSKEKRKT